MNEAPRSVRLAAGALLALATAGSAAGHAPLDARRCTREDAQSAGYPGTTPDAQQRSDWATAISAEVVHRLPEVTVETRALPSPAHRPFEPIAIVDHFDLISRLRRIRHLKLLSLFEDARMSLFVGVDRHGLAGLYLEQRSEQDLPSLLAHASVPGAAVPLPSAALDSP